ncbi:MAG: hypothetical protein JWP89_5543 [Schlesneria sp.]|nr:hypothetical protein [Schlesneria sp.]
MAKYSILVLFVLLVMTTSDALGWLHVFPEKDLKSMRRSFVGGSIEQQTEETEDDPAFTAPSYGYMINSSAYHFFNGDTTTLNRWLEKEALGLQAVRTETTVAKVVIHTGVGDYKSPANLDQIKRRADWSLAHFPDFNVSDGGKKIVPTLDIKIHVWISDKVRLDELKIPQGFMVESGDEIEQFIRTRSAAETAPADATKPSKD